MKCSLLFIIIFFASGGCIERYQLPALEVKPVLVVDGGITNEPGPYRISLLKSYILNRIVKHPEPLRNATVEILDDHGNSETLTETIQGGEYFTSASGIQGTVGRKYHLKITTSEGREYATEPQLLTHPGEIINLRYEVFPNSINKDDVLKPQHTVKFFIDSRGSSEQGNFLRWRWRSTYEIKNQPEEQVRKYGHPQIVVPNPPECSGVRPGGPRGVEIVKPCTCCTCWISNTSYGVLLSNNRYFSVREFEDVLIATIPVEKRTFDIRFHLRVDQLSLSEDAYHFWKLVQAQQHGEGSLFVPNSIRVRGNVSCLSDPDELVVGVFSVSGVASKSIFLSDRDIPYEVEREKSPKSCLDEAGATDVRPSFW